MGNIKCVINPRVISLPGKPGTNGERGIQGVQRGQGIQGEQGEMPDLSEINEKLAQIASPIVGDVGKVWTANNDGTAEFKTSTGGSSEVTQIINVASPPAALSLTAMVGVGQDSTAGWNSIMDYAAANPGCVLKFPWDPLGFKLNPAVALSRVPSNTKLIADGLCKIWTAATALYNIMIRLGDNASDILIDGLTFDQWSDVAQTPNSGTFQGCHIIWGGNFNRVKIQNCKFYGYGVTSILFQPTDSTLYGDKVESINNEFHWKRKTNTNYDVSICHLDARKVNCERNKVFVYKEAGVTDWKPESAFELHFPSGYVANNEIDDCKTALLHVNWPLSYTSYVATDSNVIFVGNRGNRVLRGIYLWGQHSLSGTTIKTRNMLISENYFNLRSDASYKPEVGIGCKDGGVDASFFQNVTIRGNHIELTIADAATYTDGGPYFYNVGAISLATSNSFENVLISENIVENFPYSAINCIARQVLGSNMHKNIKVIDNTFIDCSYVFPNGSLFGAVVNVQYVDGFEFKRNKVKLGAANKRPKELLHVGTNVTGFEWDDNKLELSTTGYNVYFDDLTTFNAIKTDVELLRCAGTIAMRDVRRTSITNGQPTGNYAVGDIVEYTGNTSISKRGWRCTQKGTIRSLANQYATFSNAHQHYINVAGQFIAGDIVVFNGGQIGTVMRSSGNYIYTVEAITSYTAGTCSISAPVFADIL